MLNELMVIQSVLPQVMERVMTDYQSGNVEEKLKEGTVVTKTDIAVDRLITSTIQEAFPEDVIISEESSPDMPEPEQGNWWYVDPLCGSANFSSRIFYFTTNIARFDKGKPVFSLMIDYPNETYYWTADRHEGVYEGDSIQKEPSVLALGRAHHINTDSGFLIEHESPLLSNFGSISQELYENGYYPVNLGSSLSFVYTAIGKFGGTIVPDVFPWDVMASCYLAEKNGGVVTDFEGKPWTYKTRDVVMSLSPAIHKNLLEIVQKHWN